MQCTVPPILRGTASSGPPRPIRTNKEVPPKPTRRCTGDGGGFHKITRFRGHAQEGVVEVDLGQARVPGKVQLATTMRARQESVPNMGSRTAGIIQGGGKNPCPFVFGHAGWASCLLSSPS